MQPIRTDKADFWKNGKMKGHGYTKYYEKHSKTIQASSEHHEKHHPNDHPQIMIDKKPCARG